MGALALLERVCDNRVDRPVGGIIYTQFLNERGGIVGDVTVTRLSDDRFRVTTGSAAVDADLGWLRMHERVEDGPVELRDGSEDLSVLGLWGPLARDVLASVTESDVSNDAFPYLSTLELRVGPAPVFAQRISWVGELGWELWVEPRWAVAAWDRLVDAGRAHGLEPCGYRVLEGLRSERGYRALDPTSPPATLLTRRACPSASTYPRTSSGARRSWPRARPVRRLACERSLSATRTMCPSTVGRPCTSTDE